MKRILVWLTLAVSIVCRISEDPSAFTLARIQKDYDDEEQVVEDRKVGKNSLDTSRKRDDVVNDEKCLQRCNDKLNIGMDMVNAHMAFGAIDVPSVVDKRDLELFCILDYQHSKCIDECGYSVQFNLREFVCRQRFNEMTTHMKCYSKAAPALIRHCRPRCGGYKPLVHTMAGYSQRCRQLLCDHTCISYVLKKVCPGQEGEHAADYLLDFTKIQVDYWMRDATKESPSKSAPASCKKLECRDFKLSNCRRRMWRRRRTVLRRRRGY